MSRWDDDEGQFGDAPTERGPVERPPVSSGGYAGYDATVPAGDSTQYMPPPGGPGDGPPGTGGPDDRNRRQRMILFWVAGILAAIIIVLLILLLTSSGSSNSTSTSTSSSTSTSTATTTATTTVAGVSVQSFNTPSTVTCSSATTISVSWSAPNATQVTLSIDGAGAFKTYSGPTGADSVPFACDGHSHTYTITARNSVSSQSRTQTVSQISPPTTSPST